MTYFGSSSPELDLFSFTIFCGCRKGEVLSFSIASKSSLLSSLLLSFFDGDNVFLFFDVLN
jgi:hypothetical protein